MPSIDRGLPVHEGLACEGMHIHPRGLCLSIVVPPALFAPRVMPSRERDGGHLLSKALSENGCGRCGYPSCQMSSAPLDAHADTDTDADSGLLGVRMYMLCGCDLR